MTDKSNHMADLLARAGHGDEAALRELFDEYRDRLKRMIRLRMSRRLKTRMDDSDILQEAYLEVAKKLPEYTQHPEAPFFLWLRKMTGLKLAEWPPRMPITHNCWSPRVGQRKRSVHVDLRKIEGGTTSMRGNRIVLKSQVIDCNCFAGANKMPISST